MVGYVDADWLGNTHTRQSATADVFKVCGSDVAWQSQLQSSIAEFERN
jgi:hypothetical protein